MRARHPDYCGLSSGWKEILEAGLAVGSSQYYHGPSTSMAFDRPTQPAALLWPATQLPQSISGEEIHVWAWSFRRDATPQAEDLRILDDRERQRTTRFRFPADQVRYSVCHASMRRVLASYLDTSPELLAFGEGPGGKPELALEPQDRPLQFNLSHSKSIGLLAVARNMEVGVDVEDIRPIETGVAERFFSSAEVASLRNLHGLEWLDAFYRCWTRKEAILKAEGVGLRIPLGAFDVSLADESAALLAVRPQANLTAAWQLHNLAPAEGSIGSLAVGRPASTVRQFALLG